MPVRLRPHHLLCLLTDVGKGYGEAFTVGLGAIVARLSQGAPIQVVDGPDDIGGPLRDDGTAPCGNESVRQRDRHAAADLGALLQRPIGPGMRLTLDSDQVATLRGAFAHGRTRKACEGCEWHALCTSVAAEGFVAARLKPAGTPDPSRPQGAARVLQSGP
jgi:hypothetical protein